MGFLKRWVENLPVSGVCKYVGGFPEWTSDFEFAVKVYKDKTFKFHLLNKVYLEDNLDNVEVLLEDERQLSERVTATRLFVLGIFAFAFKKKKMNNNKYITFRFKEIDLKDVRRKYKDVDIILTAKNPKVVENIYNGIVKLKAQY